MQKRSKLLGVITAAATSSREGITLYLKEGGKILFPSRRQANYQETSRLLSPGDHAYAVLAPGVDNVGTCVDRSDAKGKAGAMQRLFTGDGV